MRASRKQRRKLEKNLSEARAYKAREQAKADRAHQAYQDAQETYRQAARAYRGLQGKPDKRAADRLALEDARLELAKADTERDRARKAWQSAQRQVSYAGSLVHRAEQALEEAAA